MSFTMPATGALFTMALLTVFLLRLVVGEEAFLKAQFGAPYQDYLRAAPRLIPQVRTNLPPTGQKPKWGRAILAELTPVGIFLVVAILSWRYDERLMIRGFLISFGISLVARALMLDVKRKAA